jgi:BirA family biotin operon repressor/biotin-[acetyl-CoA-carboxylase] ligase
VRFSPPDGPRAEASLTLIGAGSNRRLALLGSLMGTLAAQGLEDHPVSLSGEELARALGLSRAAVHKHVEHLRGLGFAVASTGGSGYRLARPFTDLVAPEAVLPFLLDALDLELEWHAGLPYRYRASCGSTNQVLRREVASAPSGTTVVTDDQTEGRGRLGRGWMSAPGEDLTFSVLVRPRLAPAQAHLLSLAAALAVSETIEEIAGLEGRVKIKWPNDVLLDEDKVCGILLEGSLDTDRVRWAIAGIGLNVNSSPGELVGRLPPEQRAEWRGRPHPVSLRDCLGREVERAPLLARLLCRLTHRWHQAGAPGLLEELSARDSLVGRHVVVTAGPPDNEPVVEGKAAGIGPEGQLLVVDATGKTVPVFAGEASVTPAGAERG